MEHVQVLVFDGFDALDAIASFEILAAAGFAVQMVAFDVRTAHGVMIPADARALRVAGAAGCALG